jgi:hypothetical protein
MGANINLLGINKKDIYHKITSSETYSKYFNTTEARQNITYETLNLIDLSYFIQKNIDYTDKNISKEFGIENFYSNTIKKYCFELQEMFIYFFQGYSWDNDIEITHTDNGYLISKCSVVNLIDWYIALCTVYDEEDRIHTDSSKDDNFKNAIIIKEKYNPNYEYFKFSLNNFKELKERILNSNFENFLWVYSF